MKYLYQLTNFNNEIKEKMSEILKTMNKNVKGLHKEKNSEEMFQIIKEIKINEEGVISIELLEEEQKILDTKPTRVFNKVLMNIEKELREYLKGLGSSTIYKGIDETIQKEDKNYIPNPYKEISEQMIPNLKKRYETMESIRESRGTSSSSVSIEDFHEFYADCKLLGIEVFKENDTIQLKVNKLLEVDEEGISVLEKNLNTVRHNASEKTMLEEYLYKTGKNKKENFDSKKFKEEKIKEFYENFKYLSLLNDRKISTYDIFLEELYIMLSFSNNNTEMKKEIKRIPFNNKKMIKILQEQIEKDEKVTEEEKKTMLNKIEELFSQKKEQKKTLKKNFK